MSEPPFKSEHERITRELGRTLLRTSEDPGDLSRVLRGLAAVLELLASLVPPARSRRARLEWKEEPDSQPKLPEDPTSDDPT